MVVGGVVGAVNVYVSWVVGSCARAGEMMAL